MPEPTPLPPFERRTLNCTLDGSRWPYLVQPAEAPRAVLVYLHGHYSDQYQGMTEGIYNDAFGKLRRECLARRWVYACPFYGGNSWMGPLGESGTVDVFKALRSAYPGVPVYLSGGSMGGSSAVIFACLHPEQVDGLIARCPASDIESYYAFARDSGNGTLQNIAAAIRIHYTVDGHNLEQELALRSALRHAEQFTMPVHLSHGDADTLIPVGATRELAARISAAGGKCKYVEIPGGDHDSPVLAIQWTEALDFVEYGT